MNIKTIWKEFFNPRFSTSEMENSKTRSGVKFEIATLIFDDKRQHYPTRALGRVTISASIKQIVVWDQHGECMKDGKRLPEYDLIRPTQKEIDASKPAFIAMVGLFLMLIITLIFN